MDSEAFSKGLPIGIGVGIAIGVGLGVALGNMALLGAGIAIGVGLSPLFGAAQIKKQNKDTSDEGDAFTGKDT